MNLIEYIKENDKLTLFIYFYLFVMPWNFFKGQMGVLTVILFIAWVIKYKKTLLLKLKEMFTFKPVLIFIIFILYTYSASLWSDSIKDGFSYVNNFYKYYFLLIPILFTSLNKESAKTALKIFFISFFSYVLFSLGIYLELYMVEDSTSENPKGIMAYAIVSVYMSIAVVWAIGYAFYEENKILRTLLIVCSLIALFVLFVNKSRTAHVSIIFSVFTLLIIYYRVFIINRRYLMFIPLIIVFSLFYNLFEEKLEKRYDNISHQISNMIDNNDFQGSFGLRVYFYKAGSSVIKENFIFGMGPVDNKKKLYEIQKNDENYTYSEIFTSYHSQHLDVLTGYGIVGYVLIMLSCLLLIVKLKGVKKYYYLGLSFMVVVFFNSLANVILIKKPFNYIFVSIFVILSVITYYENKEKEQLLNNS